MRVPSSETIVIRTEQLRLVKRDGTKNWQVHYKIEGVKKWFRSSANTTEIDKAKKIAERMWMKATFDHEEGRPVISKKFKPIAEIVLEKLQEEVKAGTAKPSAKDYISAIKLYLIPFYGIYNIDCVTPAVVSEFHRWRKDKVGRELSGSAQNNHNAAFNLVLDEAIERGYMGERQRPSTKNTGGESDRRAEFSQEELENLIGYFANEFYTHKSKFVQIIFAINFIKCFFDIIGIGFHEIIINFFLLFIVEHFVNPIFDV